MKTRLMLDRRWIVNWSGPNAPIGRCQFRIAVPAKPAASILPADKPWEAMSNGGATLLIEEGRWRLWYEAYDDQYKDDFDGRLCYAESADGLTWIKPSLGLVDYRGSKENNIVFDGRMSGCGFHGHCVFVDPTAPPEARYRMIFMGALRRWDTPEAWYPLAPMSFAYSADGLRWTWGRPGNPTTSPWFDPPFAPFCSDTQTVVHWNPDRRQYVGYFRTWDPTSGRSIGRAATNDACHWPHPETILTVDEADPYGVDLYNNAASVYRVPGDEAHFFFISLFDHEADTLHIQVATSRDGRHYRRLDRRAFVAPGDTFDRGGAYMCPGIHADGDECVMLYHAVPYKHGEATPDKIRYSGSYGVLRFPRDRIQGMHADTAFEFSVPVERTADGRLAATLNASVAPGGRILAGIMPAARERNYLPDFGLTECTPVTGDGIRLPLAWKGGDVPPHPMGQPLELRLRLENATLYSYSHL